jgi:YcxB-like protein
MDRPINGALMALHFTYTQEDFREAAAALAQFNSSKSKKGDGKVSQTQSKAAKFGRGLLGWIVFIFVAMIAITFMSRAVPPPGAFRGKPPPTHNFWLTVIPSAIAPALLTGFMALVAAQAGKPSGVPFYEPKVVTTGLSPKAWRLVAWLSLATFLAGLICFSCLPATLNWRPGHLELVAAGFIPWFGWLGIVSIVSRRLKKNHPGRFGHEEGSPRVPQQLEITDRGLTLSNSLFCQELFWKYFVSYLESANLLTLYTRDLTSLVIPKRAFADLQAMDQFCGLLQARIPAGQFLPRASGFQVLPLPLPPVPAIPVDGR